MSSRQKIFFVTQVTILRLAADHPSCSFAWHKLFVLSISNIPPKKKPFILWRNKNFM